MAGIAAVLPQLLPSDCGPMSRRYDRAWPTHRGKSQTHRRRLLASPDPDQTPLQLARGLVERGKASPRILGPEAPAPSKENTEPA